MRHIIFSEELDTLRQRLPFFLATEEWVARHLPAGDYFFSWQVDPTVICGRNQEIDKEVDLTYCSTNGIDVVRRRSGGGAVFADRENFMFSFITPGDNVTEEFARYTSMIATALCNLGIEAEATGRNDITIHGRKVSGNAFYHLPGRCIAHGTMLYNFDPRHIANALTPSKAKIESKGVKSVPNRVTCLKNENIQLSPEHFQQYMIRSITDGEPYIITPEDYVEIKKIESEYYEPGFLRINTMSGESVSHLTHQHINNTTRVEGLGEFCVDYDIDKSTNQIRNFRITGDFFMRSDVDTLLCQRLEGTECTTESVNLIIQDADLHTIIPGLTPEILLPLIINNIY